ncbi:hypothetical protein [Mycolicibacterium hippocampi]|uniref:hypothetical protein n=1 Tax=Mycolicibacterium hippocampi TaxID=659824 RepID=UPI0035170B8F
MTGLTPNQRNLLYLLAIGAHAEKTGSDAETAMDQLDTYTDRSIANDGGDVMLMVGRQILVRAPRAWIIAMDQGTL